jgi:DNA-binding transcriptional MerR regulator
MTTEQRRLNPDEAAAATNLEVSIVWHYADLGLIPSSPEGYTASELAELRRVRRLREELELDHSAIEIILRMRRRMRALQAEVQRLELAVLEAHSRRGRQDWVEAEWDDLF